VKPQVLLEISVALEDCGVWEEPPHAKVSEALVVLLLPPAAPHVTAYIRAWALSPELPITGCFPYALASEFSPGECGPVRRGVSWEDQLCEDD
jgi:hypothetical protein